MKFSINSSTVTQERNPILPMPNKPFNKVRLESCEYLSVENKKKETNNVLDFIFVSLDGLNAHRERFFAPNESSDKFEKNVDLFVSKVGHILKQFGAIPDGVIEGSTIEELMQNIAKFINTPVVDGVAKKTTKGTAKDDAVYSFTDVVMWIKLVYTDSGYVSIPYKPNFLEKISAENKNETAPRTLQILPNVDKINPDEVSRTKKSNSSNSGAPGADITDDDLPAGWAKD